uniref:hypothetical protein n=1 Tax=Devosia aurantiaca TaxID=2714858 RepID=UPI002E292F82|nr:hypothetical protein [Devosia aurantiaca]
MGRCRTCTGLQARSGPSATTRSANVMAGQLFETASKDAAIADGLATGNYEPLRAYMVENVHQHGRRFTRDELLVKATGRKLDPEPYIAYLTGKYSELYSL